jgi:hypothetical protein
MFLIRDVISIGFLMYRLSVLTIVLTIEKETNAKTDTSNHPGRGGRRRVAAGNEDAGAENVWPTVRRAKGVRNNEDYGGFLGGQYCGHVHANYNSRDIIR